MKISTKKLFKSQKEITIELEQSELAPYLKKAVSRLSKKYKFNGFRPGKIPYEIVKQKLGEAVILNEAIDDIVRETYIQAIKKEKIEPIDMPKIEVLKAAPNNPFIYKAVVSLLPKTKICDLEKIIVNKEKVEVGEKKVDMAIKKLSESRTKEKLVNREVKERDMVKIDLDIFQNNIAIEGGNVLGHKIIIGEPYYIPGFDKKLLGLKENDKKEFEITFPKEHYNKNLAGKLVKCKIKVKGVYDREIPKIDDLFAKSLGEFKNLTELKKQIKQNFEEEENTKEEQRQEIKMFEQLVKESVFEELPDVLIVAEVKKMIQELEANLSQQGVELKDYLSHLKKTITEIEKDFLPQASERVKTALFIREYAIKNNIKTSEKEINQEIKKMSKQYSDSKNNDQFKSESYRNYLKNILTNKKAVDDLKKKIIK
ncbi:MAG: trigger factor [Patescibacteria group bacterium]|nr:trigger factor [Patescibacteria group bacterium]